MSADDVLGIGIDFTACTMLPVDADGAPLCTRRALPERAARLGQAVEAPRGPAGGRPGEQRGPRTRRNVPGSRYGGKISSEWMFPKILQILHEAPHVYHAADRFMEAADWVICS